jgi:hypothetical protein
LNIERIPGRKVAWEKGVPDGDLSLNVPRERSGKNFAAGEKSLVAESPTSRRGNLIALIKDTHTFEHV